MAEMVEATQTRVTTNKSESGLLKGLPKGHKITSADLQQGWKPPKRRALTDKFVESLPPPPPGREDYFVRDTTSPGFWIRVYQQDRHRHAPKKILGLTKTIAGKEKSFIIGPWNEETLCLTQARGEYAKIHANLDKGLQAFEHRFRGKPITVDQVFQDWRSTAWEQCLAQSTQERYLQHFTHYVSSDFKRMLISAVTPDDIKVILKRVRKGGITFKRKMKVNFKEYKTKPSESVANHVVAMLSSLFAYQLAKDQKDRGGLLENPCARVKPYQSDTSFVWLNSDELQRLIHYCEDPNHRKAPGVRDPSRHPEPVMDAILFLAHTGLRHDEGLTITVGQVDLEHGWMYFKVTKTGPKKPKIKPTKPIRISRPVETLLLRIMPKGKGVSAETPIFPGCSDPKKPWSGLNKEFAKIRARTAINPKCTIHSLRHTYASDLLHAGLNRFEVQEAGGWASASSVDRYLHVRVSHAHLKAAEIAAARTAKPSDKGGLKEVARRFLGKLKGPGKP